MRLSSLPQYEKDGAHETHPLGIACAQVYCVRMVADLAVELGTVMQFVCTDHQNVYGTRRHSDGMACNGAGIVWFILG